MPRVRGFRDPKTFTLRRNPAQLAQLLLSNNLRITTSRLEESALLKVLRRAKNAHKRRLDQEKPRAIGRLKSINDGFTVAIKDNFVTSNLPTTCASEILEGFSASDATVVYLLEKAGMSVVAKTNMDEFGMGSHSMNSAYGAVRSQSTAEALSVGGSSGGSALAVATGLVDAALGSDTGGSVRLPAAYTSIIGFKPSYGKISRRGLVPYANSLDTVGIFGRSCLDVWFLFQILARYDAEDPTSLSSQSRNRIQQARNARVGRESIFRFETLRPLGKVGQQERHEGTRKWSTVADETGRTRRIGVPVEYNIHEMHPVVRSAWIRTLSNLQYLGHDIIPVSLPSTQQALSAYYILAPAEASSNLAKYDGVRYGKLRGTDLVDDADGVLYAQYRGASFGDEVKRRILLGSFTLSAGAMDNYFIQAQKVRRIVQSDFDLVFRMANPLLPDAQVNPDGVDYIICPTAPTPPPQLKELEKADPLDSYVNDVFTVPASLAGLPALSLPAHQDPRQTGDAQHAVGIQVIGQFGDDLGVIHFARKWLEPYSAYDYGQSLRGNARDLNRFQ